MADKSISELNPATSVGATDLFVIQQAGVAKKLTGQTLENWLLSMADGHGGIQSLEKTSSTGTNPVVETYTITYADTTTSTFTVTNGIKGDTGARTYLHIKYSSVNPTRDADMGDTPDNYIGICTDTNSTAPTHYTSYSWFKIKGETGATGAAATITGQSVQYQASSNGTIIPTGTWSNSIPAVAEGQYLWTRTIVTYNSGVTTTAYSVGYKGVNGTGAGDMTKQVYDPQGSVESAGGIPAYVGGQIPSAAQQNPQMDGQANVGSSSDYARADHAHPSDTAKANTNLSNVSNGAVKTEMLDSSVVTADKIGANAVSRDKLADDALYSPVVLLTTNRNLALTDLGKTLLSNYSASDATRTITLTQAISTNLPVGFECAICRMWNNSKCRISFSGVRVTFAGQQIASAASPKTVNLPEMGSMVALKKMESNSSSGDVWLLTGSAEVVS